MSSGVCRDFAHLGIAFCRALGVPARYVSAYAWRLEPPDFHGVFEAFLRGPSGFGWYMFDPTRMADPRGIVRIGLGRDAAEVAFCTQFGQMEFDKPEVSIEGPSDAFACHDAGGPVPGCLIGYGPPLLSLDRSRPSEALLRHTEPKGRMAEPPAAAIAFQPFPASGAQSQRLVGHD